MTKPVGTSVRSVEKAMSIVRILAQAPVGLSLSEIARALDLNESTAHHLVATLRDGGFVKQSEATKVYRLGDSLVQLVTGFLTSTDLFSAGSGPVIWLRDRTGESAYLNDFRGTEPVTMMELPGWNPIQVRRTSGPHGPHLHCTSTGKLFLTSLGAERRDHLLETMAYQVFTPNTIGDRQGLERELELIRQQRFALDREEHRTGVRCITVPFYNHHGTAVGSISLSFPAGRMAETEAFLPLVAEASQRVSVALGHPGAVIALEPVPKAS